jgi:ribosomal protein S18 acetylase RimI-like enzyme
MSTELTFRPLAGHELVRVAEIDRTERIDATYLQRGSRLELVEGERSAPPWDHEGAGMHSVAALREMLESTLERGASAVGAFDGGRLVGFGMVLPHVRPRVAQLVALYVSNADRGRGVGVRLCDELDRIARAAGDVEMVVSATPSANTVSFYVNRGFAPTADPLPELYELEPEDVHMWKPL